MVHTVAFRKSGLYYILRLFNFCTSAWNNEEIFKESWQEKKKYLDVKQMNWKFFWFVVNWRKNKRNEVLEIISKVNQDKVLIFHNRKQLNKWYQHTFNKKNRFSSLFLLSKS